MTPENDDIKSDAAKILEWALSLERSNPEFWEKRIEREISTCEVVDRDLDPVFMRAMAIAQIIKSRVWMCESKKAGIPPDIRWSGRESEHDKDCQRCLVLESGGRLRYLGYHYFGTEKVASVWYEDDDEVSGDVDVPQYLHCWRCEVCWNEDTDDWFLD